MTPSFQRLDKTKKSLQYVHSYAVKDRVNLCDLSDDPPAPCKHLAEDLLPSAADIERDFCVYILVASTRSSVST